MSQLAPNRLPAWRLAAFAALAIPLAGAGLPLAVYLPPYYAQDLGLGLGAVGLIFMLSRAWDAVTDPLVGVLSDRTRSRFGRRSTACAARTDCGCGPTAPRPAGQSPRPTLG